MTQKLQINNEGEKQTCEYEYKAYLYSSGPELTEISEGILVADYFFSKKQCEDLVAYVADFLVPTNAKNAPPKKVNAFRNNERYLHFDIKAAKYLWQTYFEKLLFRVEGIDDNTTAREEAFAKT